MRKNPLHEFVWDHVPFGFGPDEHRVMADFFHELAYHMMGVYGNAAQAEYLWNESVMHHNSAIALSEAAS